ncbi:hypothetical protein CRYUN_Cryun31cG0040400 [Craigia yunnanensis]
MDNLCFNFLSVLLIQCFVGSLVITAANLTTYQSALLEFKNSINPNTVLANNWTTSTSVCNWIGVSCSSNPERVTSLNLHNMNLTGTVSPHLGNLSSLLSLYLSGNYFNGYLPSTVYNLSYLQIIDLTSSGLSGDLPDDLCNYFPKLEVLRLDFNEFSGSVPSSLGDCTNLQNLSVSYNRFNGFIPRSIGNLTRLKEVHLGGNSLQGEIPWEIGYLFNLEIFTAENNSGLTGGIPPSMFNISSLTKLNLVDNSLSGGLPDNMCNHLSKLEVLRLGLNDFTGHIPSTIGECSNLQDLTLSTNRFNGTIPRSIGNLTSLKRLSLRENHLTGEIPWEIGNLYSLEILAVQHMRLTGPIPPSIFNISSLKEISLSNNSLSGEITSTISITNLEVLRLSKNNLSGNIPNFISNASKLITLSLEENSFSGLIPNTLGNLRFLERLSFASNNLITETSTHEWSFLSSLANCRNLKYLAVSFNPLNGILPSSISNLSTSLQYFYASGVKITGSIPREIGDLSNITILNLSHNELSGSIPATIGRLRNIQGLYLDGNHLQGSIPPSVCDLERLNTLSLGGNILHGPIPTCLANLTSLRYLYLDSNKLNSIIPLTLWSLNDILVVDLSSNFLNGSLPLGIENLKVLIHLNLSRNLFSGEILISIGRLQDLLSLDLSNNRFDGQISELFGNLISLESLDLSNNNLSGVIPKSLERLSFLNHFNVSVNRLEGEIPTGGPFRNFSAKSFMKNYGLCSSRALQVLPCKSRQSKMTPLHVLKYVLPVVTSIILMAAFIIVLKRCRKRSRNLPVNEDLLPLKIWRRISYNELLQATNGFDECNLLGSGSFGSVYIGTLSDGMTVAIKVFNMQSEGGFKSFDVECETMRNIFHRNLVKIITSCSNVDFKALLFEFMPNGSLEKWLYSYNYFLNILQRIDIMIDVASALEYLHFGCPVRVIHCDLKPSNILLDKDMVAYVGDFGIAKLLEEEDSMRQTMTLATFGYMAPEYGSTGIVSCKGDVYSYGILLMETFTRKKPTDGIFSGEMSLKDCVKKSLSDDITAVLDANLLRREAEHFIDSLGGSDLSIGRRILGADNYWNSKVVLLHGLKDHSAKFNHFKGAYVGKGHSWFHRNVKPIAFVFFLMAFVFLLDSLIVSTFGSTNLKGSSTTRDSNGCEEDSVAYIHEERSMVQMYGRLLNLASSALAEEFKQDNLNFWEEPYRQASKWEPCADREHPASLGKPEKSNGYIMVSANGGLNQQRVAICNAVAVASLLNPSDLQWNCSQFGDIYQEDYFMRILKDDLDIVKELPPHLKSLDIEAIGSLITDADIAKQAKPNDYVSSVLPLLVQNKVVHFLGFGNRLGFDPLPPDLQRLRCKCNFRALKFVPKIQEVGSLLIKRIRKHYAAQRQLDKQLLGDFTASISSKEHNAAIGSSRYLALHLRFEEDMVAYSCDFGGGEYEKKELEAYRLQRDPLSSAH